MKAKALHILLFIIFIFANWSCTISCRDQLIAFESLKDCNIVIKYNKSNIHTIDISGYNPNNQKAVKYSENDPIYINIYNKINIGDTLFKNSNYFLLKKKDYNVKFSIKCGTNDEFLGLNQDTIPKL